MLLVLIVNIQVLDGTEKTTIIEIQDTEEVSVLKQMIQFESEITPSEQKITFNGNAIKDSGLISQSGLENNANIVVKQIANRGYTQQRIDPNITPEALIELARSTPQLLQDISDSDPEYGAAIREADVGKVRTIMMKRILKRHEQGFKRDQEQMQIERDPDNPEHQRKMLEAIRQQNVQQNMELAYEELPEAFGTIHMLYVNVTINDTPLKAFVDSGAQSTIMSAACAERVGIMRLIDTRYAGEARGVGTAKILGRVHIAQMKFGNTYLPISITILAQDDVDFLFGLDTLRRYRCCIDLGKNVLRIDGNNGPEELSFLSENDTGPTTIFQGKKVPKPESAPSDGKLNDVEASSSSMVKGEGTVSASSSSASASSLESTLSDEQKVNQLQALGFSKSESEQALVQAEGEVNLAATLLFSSR